MLGVSIGPNLTYAGSLATLQWRPIAREDDTSVDLGEFTRLGLLTAPAAPAPGGAGPVGLTARHRRLIPVTVIAWIVEGTWPACVDGASTHAPHGAGIVLLHVTGHDVPGAAHGAYAGLFGRGRPERDPGTRLQQLAAASAQQRGHELACDP